MEKKSIDDSSSKICTFLYVTKRKGFYLKNLTSKMSTAKIYPLLSWVIVFYSVVPIISTL